MTLPAPLFKSGRRVNLHTRSPTQVFSLTRNNKSKKGGRREGTYTEICKTSMSLIRSESYTKNAANPEQTRSGPPHLWFHQLFRAMVRLQNIVQH